MNETPSSILIALFSYDNKKFFFQFSSVIFVGENRHMIKMNTCVTNHFKFQFRHNSQVLPTESDKNDAMQPLIGQNSKETSQDGDRPPSSQDDRPCPKRPDAEWMTHFGLFRVNLFFDRARFEEAIAWIWWLKTNIFSQLLQFRAVHACSALAKLTDPKTMRKIEINLFIVYSESVPWNWCIL